MHPYIGCIGKTTQDGICDEGECPIWDNWTDWSTCSISCGTGLKKRARNCLHGTWGQAGCEGDQNEEVECNSEPCPFLTKWAESECTASCGGGKIARSRSCVHYVPGVHECVGETIDFIDCNEQTCPHWGDWGQFASCSKSCGGGTTKRVRKCQDGLEGQLGCEEGQGEEISACNVDTCPFWIQWLEWESCSRSCSKGAERGQKKRSRLCIHGNQGEIGCEGPLDEFDECSTQLCPHWTDWKSKTSCSATCGDGFQSKFRNCVNGEPDVTPECMGKARYTIFAEIFLFGFSALFFNTSIKIVWALKLILQLKLRLISL